MITTYNQMVDSYLHSDKAWETYDQHVARQYDINTKNTMSKNDWMIKFFADDPKRFGSNTTKPQSIIGLSLLISAVCYIPAVALIEEVAAVIEQLR